MWQLLEEPWTIIESLLAETPEIAAKLEGLCFHLKLDRDDFTARRTMSMYLRNSTCGSPTVTNSFGSKLMRTDLDRMQFEATLFESIDESMSSISNLRQRVEIWRWIFEKERSVNVSRATRAIESALAILDTHSSEKNWSMKRSSDSTYHLDNKGHNSSDDESDNEGDLK